jgi:hypothetical protein
MAPDYPTDGRLRHGEPPYRSGPGPEAASTDELGASAAIHPATVILVWSLRVVAVLIVGWAGLGAFFAVMFRFDSSDELEMIKQADLELGGAFALSVVLFFAPSRLRKPVHCVIILAVAVLVWLFVSWNLIAHHEWVDRVRSGL